MKRVRKILSFIHRHNSSVFCFWKSLILKVQKHCFIFLTVLRPWTRIDGLNISHVQMNTGGFFFFFSWTVPLANTLICNRIRLQWPNPLLPPAGCTFHQLQPLKWDPDSEKLRGRSKAAHHSNTHAVVTAAAAGLSSLQHRFLLLFLFIYFLNFWQRSLCVLGWSFGAEALTPNPS